jgi:hypothetical protein
LNYNDYAFAMSAIGNFDIYDKGRGLPPPVMLRAFGRLFAWKLSLHGVDPASTHQWVGHRWLDAIDGELMLAVNLGTRGITEALDLLEPFVLVQDEHRQDRADAGPERHQPARGGRVAGRFDAGDAGAVDRAPAVHGADRLGPRLLAEDDHVVAGRPERPRGLGRVDVRPGAIQQPAVPHQDPHGGGV